ncbi:MAG: SDR family NAD(P)-dependent oxidoreductase [Burkholderiaceae bacterium]|jgi:NAD(P)-dependent dehydrogenase (short-subunit alcohol dehydrogenase family)|nr:SDR family NAD(P)-dependent oxidoreductase [Burkholderiaceae bacterium]
MDDNRQEPGVCCVIGAGDATGSAIARRFAREGYEVCVARRTAAALQPLVDGIVADGGRARAFGLDARREEQVGAFFDRVEADVGPVQAVVFNVGGNVRFPILETTAQKYFKVWEMCALAGFLVGREAARVMLPRGRGTLLFTGATASLRGGAGFAAFAGGKAALRALSQSMARELGPQGLHVAHVVIDGLIDTAFAREHFAQRVAAAGPDGILHPDHIAEAYWWLHRQPRDAWTFELDLRPSVERW